MILAIWSVGLPRLVAIKMFSKGSDHMPSYYGED